MATYIPLTNLPTQFFDSDGAPLSSGVLRFYLAGTTTATDLYSDSSGTSIGTSITLNSWGFPESGGSLVHLFRDQSKAIKITAETSGGSIIYTADNIPAVASFDSTASTKLGLITVTSAVNLDDLSTDVGTALQKDWSVTPTADTLIGSGNYITWSVTAGITASTTQTQGEGALVNSVNEVSTVANNNDTVTLPTAVAGRQVVVINNGANTLQIFPASGDAINGAAADASTTAASGDNIIFVAYDVTNWEAI